MELEEHAEALDVFRRALQIDPRSNDACYNLADAQDSPGRGEEALPHWHTYLRHDPGSRWKAYAR
jgi:tetratricopeptide (TPR) repeat protein